jgi:hypothetical protein
VALSSDTYWDVNGIPLQTYAYNITTWGGDLQAPPPLRGEDLTIPYRPGQVLQTRRPEGRSVTFDMWVVGADVDGNVPQYASMRAEFEKNFKMLRSLFWNQGKPVTLTKRWRDYSTGAIQSASARAIFANGLSPTMHGGLRASFSVELYLPDPFFYGSELTVNFPASASSSSTPNILGDYETTVIRLDVNGARNNFRLTNTSEGVYVNVNQSLASGQLIRLEIDNWTARKNPSTDNSNVIASVTSLGHPFWFVLRPGAQALTLTSSSGTGSATLKYRPRWL